MTPRKKKSEQDLMRTYSIAKCAELVTGMTETAEGVNSEGLCRALLPIFDQSKDIGAVEAVGGLMRAAYQMSVDGDEAFEEYLEKLRKQKPEVKRESIKSAAQDVTETQDNLERLLTKHANNPRIRARLVEVIESRMDGGEEGAEVIEPDQGEIYIFIDQMGFPVLTVQMLENPKTLLVEAKDTDSRVINGFVVDYSQTRGRKTEDLKATNDYKEKPSAYPLIDALADLLNVTREALRSGDKEGLSALKVIMRAIKADMRDPEPSPEPTSQAAPSTKDPRQGNRFDNVMWLGQDIIAILKNPETPKEIRNSIVDSINELLIDKPLSWSEHIERHWSHVAEILLAKPQQEGGKS
jgi:hypothetical protein